MNGAVQLGVAMVGAVGTIISAWLVARVRQVQKTVNGHTAMLEARIDQLQAQLWDRTSHPGETLAGP